MQQPTNYKGVQFESEVAARWAVFFDAQGIEWQYRQRTFELPRRPSYTPDFWLPQVRMWAKTDLRGLTDQEKIRASLVVLISGFDFLLLTGLPNNIPYWAITLSLHSESIIALSVNDYCLTSQYLDEHRFYSGTGGVPELADFDDVESAAAEARSYRFGTSDAN